MAATILLAYLAWNGGQRLESHGSVQPSKQVLLLVVIVVLAATISHVVLSVTVQLLWIALLVVAVPFATGHLRYPRQRQDR